MFHDTRLGRSNPVRVSQRTLLPVIAVGEENPKRPSAATKWRDALRRVRRTCARGHDGAWPSRIKRRARARRNVALQIT